MRRFSSALWGLLLVAVGILFLVQNLGLLGPFDSLVWTVLFATAGVIFVGTFVRNQAYWWALIPGFTLLALAALIGLGDVLPAAAGRWGGPLFLAGIGLGFWAVYLTHREHWWAVIPGGTLVTLAAVAGLSDNRLGFDAGGILFIGLGLTFGLLYFLPTPQGRMKWAIFPAIPLLLFGAVVILGAAGLLQYLWPAALVLVGVYLLYRTFRARTG